MKNNRSRGLLIVLPISFILFLLNGFSENEKSVPKDTANNQSIKTTLQIQRDNLKCELDGIFSAPDFANSLWGVCVQKMNGETLYDNNGNKWLLPASNLKIYTGAASLDILGADFRYETRLEAVGKISHDGTLVGNIVITGSGDPSLGSWHIKGCDGNALLLKQWAEELKKKGITEVLGNVIGDGRIFTEQYYSNAWEIDDLPYWYAAGSSGLAIEENCFRFTLAPGKNIGDKAFIRLNPETAYITVVNDTVTTVPGTHSTGDIVWRGTDSNVIRFAGTVALDAKPFEQRGSVWDGAKYAAVLFREALIREGIKVSGDGLNIRELKNADIIDRAPGSERILIAAHQSQPLPEFLTLINKTSHNFFADHLLRTLGYQVKKKGDFETGADVVKEWLKKIGTPDAESLVMSDGSGLSRRNLVQPRQTCAILRYLYQKESLRKAYYDSLSIGGVDGELKDRMKEPPLKEKVRAKAGYIGFTRCLSGYVTDADGETLVFSMMVNQSRQSLDRADELIDKSCRRLAEYTERQ